MGQDDDWVKSNMSLNENCYSKYFPHLVETGNERFSKSIFLYLKQFIRIKTSTIITVIIFMSISTIIISAITIINVTTIIINITTTIIIGTTINITIIIITSYIFSATNFALAITAGTLLPILESKLLSLSTSSSSSLPSKLPSQSKYTSMPYDNTKNSNLFLINFLDILDTTQNSFNTFKPTFLPTLLKQIFNYLGLNSIRNGGTETFCPPGTYFGLRVLKHFWIQIF